MRCKYVERQLSAFIDGELSKSEAEAIHRHLKACGRCAVEYEDLLKTAKLLDATTVLDEVFLADRIMQRIAGEPIEPLRTRRPLATRRSIWVAAALLFLCLGVWHLAGLGKPKKEPAFENYLTSCQSLADSLYSFVVQPTESLVKAQTELAVKAKEIFKRERSSEELLRWPRGYLDFVRAENQKPAAEPGVEELTSLAEPLKAVAALFGLNTFRKSPRR